MVATLTPAQRKVYDFIRDYMERHGYPPSHEEIRVALGFSSRNSVRKHLLRLEERGYVKLPLPNRKRALELVPLEITIGGGVRVPLLGTVAAGKPVEAFPVPEIIELPENFLGRGENYCLVVAGDSMIDDDIRTGDILILLKQPRAENGQIVVARVGGESTLKVFYRYDDTVELRPCNKQMEPIRVPADEVEIEGVLIGQFRNHRRQAKRFRNSKG